MKKSYLMIAMAMTLLQGCTTAPPYQTSSHVGVGAAYPGVSFGIHYSSYPDLVRIPGYPVYYASRLDSNYFFYDGLYWVFYGDIWYASSWYNGPWSRVSYYDVPVYVLRVPVRYYRQPPPYYRNWRADAPPRWGDHWGRDWEQRRSGWDRWDHRSAPAPAPLPAYQRNYSGDRYPRAAEQQHTIRSEHYRYQPQEPVTQQYYKPRVQQEQQRQQEQQQRQLEQQRQQDQQRELEQQRRLEEQRRQDQQRELEQQRHQDQQRRLEQQRELEQQQRQQEQRRQPEQQRRQDQQRQPVQQQRQEQQRQLDPQQQRDMERQRPQAESRGKARDEKAGPQDRVQRDKESQQEHERKTREYEERYPSR